MEQLETFCKTEYQREMDKREKEKFKGQDAFCLLGENRCPYYKADIQHDYCQLNKYKQVK